LLDGSGNRRWSFDLADQLALDPLAHMSRCTKN
jgi:hypothetical protein